MNARRNAPPPARGSRKAGSARRRRRGVASVACLLLSLLAGYTGGAVVRSVHSGRDAVEKPSTAIETGGGPRAKRTTASARAAAESHFQAGYAHLLAEHYPQALVEFEHATACDPTDPRPHHGSGKVYQAMFLPARAEESFGKAIIAEPRFLESKKALATLLHDAGRHRAAVELLEPLAKQHPGDTFVRGELAINLLRLGETQRAVELLESYNRAEGEQAWGWSNLGRAYEEAGEVEKADAAYRRALRVDPTSSITYFWLGNLLVSRGRDEEAQPFLERYRELRELLNAEHQLKLNLLRVPDDVQTLVRLAEMRFRRGRKTEALQTLEKARALAPNDRPLAQLYAKIHEAVERETRGE